jgi:hypothetical protein
MRWKDANVLKEEFEKDEHLQKIVTDLQQNPNAKPGFEFKHGVLLYEGRLLFQINQHSFPPYYKSFTHLLVEDTPVSTEPIGV